jgi:hypothetical protein
METDDYDESDTDYIDDLFVKDLIRKKLLNLPYETEPFIETEIEFIKKSVLECLSYILMTNNVLRDSHAFNEGKIYRAGLLRDVDKAFMPLGKAISKNCGVEDENEAIWFSSSNLDHYMKERIKKENKAGGEKVYGIQTCKKFRKISSIKFINLSSDEIQLCKGTPTFLLNRDLQFLFNTCLIIPLIRNYSSMYAYENKKLIKDFENDTIFKNKKIKIDKHVPGYPCKGIMTPSTTIFDVFRAWDYNTGTRSSFLNEDRIQITLLFQLIDVFNKILEYENENIQILGWTCENTPTSKCEIFHRELAIAIKYLQGVNREYIFEKEDEKEDEKCTVKIIDPDIVGGGKRKGSTKAKNERKRIKIISDVPDIDVQTEYEDYDLQNISSSRNKSDTHLVPIHPVDLTDPFNNYKDDEMTEDIGTVPDIDAVPDPKIKEINDFLFGDIEKIIREESSAGGSKRKLKRKTRRKTRRQRKATHRKATHRKATRKHYK